jgi:protein-S-isoprenylcysteine O-methyltransferase Ste14
MDAQPTSGVRFPPPLYYVIPLVLSVATEWLFPAQRFLSPLLAACIGAALLALAVAFASSALVTMRRAGTSPVPLTPTSALVTGGPYRVTRNPMYLGLTLGYAGVAIWTQAVWAFVYLPIVILAVRRVVIDREERYLTARFGDAYVDYSRQVRRWI